MKVLVTGGTGAFGTAVCRQLARAGASPVAMARNEPSQLPGGAAFSAGDIRDPEAVRRAVSGCDAVVHLAWYMGVGADPDEIDAINVGGTKNLLEAMDRAGCRRLVFTSSTTAYGNSEHHPEPFREVEALDPPETFLYAAQKRDVEDLIAEWDLDAVVARVTVVLGRSVDNDASQAYAGPALLDIGGQSVVQAIHQDDVGRFLEQAALGSWTGTVNLAAPGALSMDEAGELLGRRVATIPLGAALRSADMINRLGFSGLDADVAKTLAYWPVADTTRLTDEWGFSPVWSQEETLRDQARSASRSTYLVPGTTMRPRRRRLPWAAPIPPNPTALRPEVGWRQAAAEGVRGSLDTKVDPTYPLYSGTNLHEAFPGPMTPLSLELALHGIGAASDCLVSLFGLEGEVGDLMRLGVASFGHHVYVNVSAARLMAELVPGATVEDVDRMYLGIDDAEASGKQRPKLREIATAARLAGRVVPRLIGYSGEVERLSDDVERIGALDPATLDDDGLLAHLSLVHDMVCQAWATSSTGNFLLSGLATAVEDDAAAGAGGGFASAASLRGVQELARRIQRDPALASALVDDVRDLDGLRTRFPEFGRAVDDLVASCGHRGPGETELSRPVFADRPELLVDLARRVGAGDRIAAAEPPAPSTRSPLARVARRVLESKELARDHGVRLIHAFRVAVRERGRRLAEADALGDPDDVYYLTYDELLSKRPPGTPVLAARRAERERLSAYRMPLTFEGTWEPEVDAAAVGDVGDVLRGVAAVPGVVEGVVRVMASPDDDLEPDEILVTHTTDIGWTPFFALTSAVVTTVGGIASHAAIVAREHGIPSVVGVPDATRRLRDGMTVRVDGTAGTIEILSI